MAPRAQATPSFFFTPRDEIGPVEPASSQAFFVGIKLANPNEFTHFV